MKRILLACLYFTPLLLTAQVKIPPTPDKIYGQLFIDVQLQQVFPDGKTFVDCTPKRKVADIMYDYGMSKGSGMDLKKFVEENFNLPPAPPRLNYIQQERSVVDHIQNLWGVLRRDADVSPRWGGKSGNGNSLLALPYPYVVPGGRFREVYYWDSYFTMLGLEASGQTEMVENMVKNFDYLIYNFGHVPNGNRTYYLSRSQPPFFCMMVKMLAEIKARSHIGSWDSKAEAAVYKKYLPSMIKEYAYWMDGVNEVKNGEANKYVVKLSDGTILNRYWDDNNTPRPESYKEDTETAEAAAMELAMRIKVASPEKLKEILDKKRNDTYRELRAAACSGWDFSSRWFAEADKISTIQTTSIVPVDLNCLLYSMETIIAEAYKLTGRVKLSKEYKQKAIRRKAAIIKYCWNTEKGFFFDYNFALNQQSNIITAAGVFPLFVQLATVKQADTMTEAIDKYLLKKGGIITTVDSTGQQWDAPNGWAPLQWITILGLNKYSNTPKQKILAKIIAQRWLALNDKVYAATGKLMEKYNVEDLTKEAGGGEYPSQDGFGWTNGVYLALKKLFTIH